VFGLWLNVVTGLALVSAPDQGADQSDFYLKLSLIAAGLLILRATLHACVKLAISGDEVAGGGLAVGPPRSSGRLLAYTYPSRHPANDSAQVS
jgi:hypothetical protein